MAGIRAFPRRFSPGYSQLVPWWWAGLHFSWDDTVWRGASLAASATKGWERGPPVDQRGVRGFGCPVVRRFLPALLLLLASPLAAQEAVRGFVAVEPFEFRLEALVKPEAWRQAWRMKGDTIGPGERRIVLDQLLALFESEVKVTSPGVDLAFTERSVRFLVPDAEKGFVPDEREAIPLSEALVGLTLSATAQGISAFDLEWRWFAPGQERLVLEIASGGKPSARLLTPTESRASWKLEGGAEAPALRPVPTPERREGRPLRLLLPLGLMMIAAAAIVVLRRKSKSPAWIGWLLVGGVAAGVVALRFHTSEVVRPVGADVEGLVHALLRNTYHAFDFRDESAIYDTLEASVTGPLLERVYLEMRSSLELENAGGPRVRVHEIALRQCEELPGGVPEADGFRTRAEWVTIGEVTHWGHTHERTNRYEAEISLTAADAWKISGLELLDEERVQKVSRRPVATEATEP